MKPANKAAQLQMRRMKEAERQSRPKPAKRKSMDRKYEVFNDEGISLGFLTVHGKVKG